MSGTIPIAGNSLGFAVFQSDRDIDRLGDTPWRGRRSRPQSDPSGHDHAHIFL